MPGRWEERVLAAVAEDRTEMIAHLGEVIRIPSVTGTDAEHDLQAVLAGELATDGLDVDHWQLPLAELEADPDYPGREVPRDEAWGVVGRLAGRGGGSTLMLNGHVDVVPPGEPETWSGGDAFSGRADAAAVHGRGACDMKAGLVAARWAVRALRVAGVPLAGDVLVAPVESEEDGGTGTFGLLRRGWRADACVAPEPTGLDVVSACAGALTFRLRVPGRAAHASRRTEGVSAIEKLWPIWRALTVLEERRNREVDPVMRRWPIAYPLSVGTVHAGDWASTVPDAVVAEGRLGVALDEDPADARADLERAVADACDGDDWLRSHPATVEWWGGQFASGRLPAASPLATQVRRAHRAVASHDLDEWGAPYGSDLRLLAGLGGIPTVHYGPGDSALAHALDERVPIAEVEVAAGTLALLAIEVCGVSG